ncbi:MAG: hypothetical protein Q8J74_11380 [Candidatus Didemnitutus sp.]|nr:hypothetical protein [Candidatus Didemnitutus sp.]
MAFANLFDSAHRAPRPIATVEVQRAPEPRNPRVERFILICWVLIAIKHGLVIWAMHHYRMPFHQLPVNAPTWLFGVLATAAYYGRRG